MPNDTRFIHEQYKCDYDYSCKPVNARTHIGYMLTRTRNMFRWRGLPDSIPERVLELYLQTNGNVCFYEYAGDLYVFTGGLGGEPDVYYRPTIYTIANPALGISRNLRIDNDCVVMPNDSLYLGLIPLFSRYAHMLTENELSIRTAIINSRIVNLITAPDDRTRDSALKYLSDIESGKLGVIADNAFLEGIKAQPFGNTASSGSLINLIEMEQYLRASWYNEIGLSANYNMKRESLNSAESALNDDILLPLVDDMLLNRQTAIEKVNAMYGTNITVDLSSSWKDNEQEIEKELQEGGDDDVMPDDTDGE